MDISETNVPDDLRTLWDLVTNALPGDPPACSAQDVRALLEEIIISRKASRELREYVHDLVTRAERIFKQS
jgi:hypothetical protein